MAVFYPTTENYSNRQVDIELLQTILKPNELQQVNLSLADTTPKIVTGLQKVAQRYAHLFLSTVGEVKFDRRQGALILSNILGGRVQNNGQLQVVFANANSNVLSQMRGDDAASVYGDIQPDERIVDARLVDSDIDFASSTVYLRVQILTQAGTTITYVVPVTASRS